jgi:hypothetical protein
MFTFNHWLTPWGYDGFRDYPKSPFMVISLDYLPLNYFDIGKTKIPIRYSSPGAYSYHGSAQPPFYLLHKGSETNQVSRKEAEQYIRECGVDAEKISDFFDKMHQHMKVIEGDPTIEPLSAPIDEPTDVVFDLDFLGGTSADTTSMEDAIEEEANHEGINVESMGSDGFSCDPSEASQALAVIRRALKRVLPKEEWELVQIVRHGPKQGQIKTCGLLPTPRKKPEA